MVSMNAEPKTIVHYQLFNKLTAKFFNGHTWVDRIAPWKTKSTLDKAIRALNFYYPSMASETHVVETKIVTYPENLIQIENSYANRMMKIMGELLKKNGKASEDHYISGLVDHSIGVERMSKHIKKMPSHLVYYNTKDTDCEKIHLFCKDKKIPVYHAKDSSYSFKRCLMALMQDGSDLAHLILETEHPNIVVDFSGREIYGRDVKNFFESQENHNRRKK